MNNEPVTRLADLVDDKPANHQAADVQTIQPATEPASNPAPEIATGVVTNPQASDPANIPSPSAADVERVRLAVAVETAAMHDRFTAGLIGGHGGGV